MAHKPGIGTSAEVRTLAEPKRSWTIARRFHSICNARNRLKALQAAVISLLHWIVMNSHRLPNRAGDEQFNTTVVPFSTPDAQTQIAAAR